MSETLMYRIAADLLLLTHFAFVLFIVLGLVLIVTGGCLQWRWIRNLWFRVIHLAAIAIVALQAWLGAICPLTTWEMSLRERAGDATYQGAFIAHWLETALYCQAPSWIFIVVYTLFALLVAAAWYEFPPRRAADLP